MNGQAGTASQELFEESDRFASTSDFVGYGGFELDLKAIRSAIMRNRWLLLGGALAGLVAGILFALLSTPIYQADTTLQIERQTPQVLGESSATLEEPTNDADYVLTQVELLKSRSLIERVGRAKNYFNDASFFARMGRDAPEGSPGSDTWQRTATAIIQANLVVEQVPDTRLVRISVTSPDRKLAQEIAVEIAHQFINSTLQRRFDTSDYSRGFLRDQIERTRQQLEQSERDLLNFMQAAGITDVSGSSSTESPKGASSTSLTDANLQAINGAYAKATADRILAEQKWRQVAQVPPLQIPEVLNNGTIQAMMANRAQKEAELEGELQRRADGHPVVIKLRAEIASIDAMIDAAAKRVRSSVEDQYEIAIDQEKSLKSSVDELRQASLNEQGRGVQLSILRREADTNRSLYDALLQRYREINAASGVTINNISVIDAADLPRAPISPKPLVDALLGALIGAFLAAALVIVRERLDDRIRSPEDVERKLGLPMLGIIPEAEGEDVLAELESPGSAIAEAVYSLRSTLQLATQTGIPRTILLTSTQPGEGKSTTAFALASKLAESGAKTLLIDVDMRRPSLHSILRLDNERGFSNYLASGRIEEADVRPTDRQNLSVMTSGPLPPNPPRFLTADVLRPAISHLLDSFDQVILDGPPVLGLADATELSASADGTLFIIEASSAGQGNTKSALRRLARSGGNLVGAVLTKLRLSQGDYGYNEYYYTYSASPSAREA